MAEEAEGQAQPAEGKASRVGADGGPAEGLTAAELRDLKPLANFNSRLEAEAALMRLDAAGIPACIQNDCFIPFVYDQFQSPCRICVPRKLWLEARTTLDRSEAEPDAIAVVENLKVAPPEKRRELLHESVAAWLRNETEPVVLARYLSAAGVSRREAEEMVREAAPEALAEIEKAPRERLSLALVAAIFSVLMAVSSLYLPGIREELANPPLSGITWGIIGGVMMFLASGIVALKAWLALRCSRTLPDPFFSDRVAAEAWGKAQEVSGDADNGLHGGET
jgi:hypothetical protein